MKTFPRLLRFLCAAAALCLWATGAEAAHSTSISTESGSGIEIEVSSDFDNLPPAGAASLRITVHNRSNRAGTWRFRAGKSYGVIISTSLTVTVPPGQTRTVPVVANLGGTDGNSSNLVVSASGPGVNGSAYFSNTHYGGGGSSTPFLAMSRDLAARSWEPLKKEIDKGKSANAFNATQFDFTDLPADWRAYAGVEWLVITDSEWDKLAPTVQAALRQWVNYGGRLVVVTQTPAAYSWNAFHRGPGAGPLSYGFGDVRAVAWDGKELKSDVLAPLLKNGSKWGKLAASEDKSWGMLSALGDLKPNTPLILGFVVIFAALVGPANLFLFAPAARRHRLFWTTPLLSLGGSLLLMAVIFLQEGSGGAGRRFTVVQLMPESHEALVVQDQVSRTGLLFGSAFQLSDECLAVPVRIDLPSQTRDRSAFAIEGKTFAGDWFRSRSLQAQRFATIRPTRAELTLVSYDAAGAPVVVSSIESPLETVILTDVNGKLWRGDKVRTGEKVTLRAASDKEDKEFREGALKPGRASLNEAVNEARRFHKYAGAVRHPVFLATVTQPKSELMGSLPSIRWKEDRVIYLGPVTQSATVQNGGTQP